MLTIAQGASVKDNPQYRVMKGGDFNDIDLVEVEHMDRPGIAEIAFQASFIGRGKNIADMKDDEIQAFGIDLAAIEAKAAEEKP